MKLLIDTVQTFWDSGFINYEEKDYIKGNLNPMFLERLYQIEGGMKIYKQ